MNYAKTAMLLAFLTALFMGVGYLLGGAGGAVIALLFAIGMNGFAFWNSGAGVLRHYHAKEIGAGDHWLYEMTADLARNADLPMPRVYIIDESQPNAFATGRNPENAAVAATTGLLRVRTKQEVAGVMAHELAHLKNRDTLIMTIAATIGGAISMLGNMAMWSAMFGGRDEENSSPLGAVGVLIAALLAPMAAMLVQMTISRTREYSADKLGGKICGNPLWLASALGKLAGGGKAVPMEAAERDPASAHLFISNPLSGRGADNLFSTHPAMENRIQALKLQAAHMDALREQIEQEKTLDQQAQSSLKGALAADAPSDSTTRNVDTSANTGPWGAPLPKQSAPRKDMSQSTSRIPRIARKSKGPRP